MEAYDNDEDDDDNDDDDDGDDDDADAKEEDDDIEEEEAIPRGISILLPTADYWSKCTKNAPLKV